MTHTCQPQKRLTIREMINVLLDEPMDNLIVIKLDNKEIYDVEICSRKPERKLGCLFG